MTTTDTGTFSLYHDLISPRRQSGEEYPATELIKVLLKTIGYDVCSPGFRKSTQSAYVFLSLARDFWDALNDLIEKSAKEDGWDSYDKYTTRIDPTEERLFEFYLLLEKLVTAQDPTTSGVSVQAYLDDIENWRNTRKALNDGLSHFSKGLNELEVSPSVTVAATIAQQHDDNSHLSALYSSISQHNFMKSGIPGQVGDAIQRIREKLSKSSTHTDVATWSIQSVMIVNAIVEILVNGQTGPELRGHLKTPGIWNATKALLDATVVLLDQRTSPDFVDVEKKWAVLVDLLKKTSPAVLPVGLIALKKIIPNIFRGYHARALQLVSECRELGTAFDGNKTHKRAEQLESAINDVTKALESIVINVPKLVPMSQLSEESRSSVRDSIRKAEDSLKECMGHYGRDASKFDVKMEAARKRDEDFMERFSKLDSNKYGGNPSAGADITVTIRVSGTNRPSKYKVGGNTLLSALLWKEASRLSNSSKAFASGRFLRDSKELSMDTKLSTLGATELTLSLVF